MSSVSEQPTRILIKPTILFVALAVVQPDLARSLVVASPLSQVSACFKDPVLKMPDACQRLGQACRVNWPLYLRYLMSTGNNSMFTKISALVAVIALTGSGAALAAHHGHHHGQGV
ncbi:hypothetical protein [Neopusillimonas aromaticivorans]|uniref:hypothetical protein n=1 Tax=Neopusillimonas aromaticivorans TaxID=2979868 RepID=UPI00259A5917|nr:hypothetical protein [Neopusillimonas aromaticivorans]WJJ94161.1 hypothetical protein N7E01_03390 [Neopusillimonas aromaticivorans]